MKEGGNEKSRPVNTHLIGFCLRQSFFMIMFKTSIKK